MKLASNRLADLIGAFRQRGSQWLSLGLLDADAETRSIEEWCERLLSGAGEASGTAIAGIVLEYWRSLDNDGRDEFLEMLTSRFGVDVGRLQNAIESYQDTPGDRTATELHRAAEPRRQELFRRLNLAEGGVATLVKMREDMLERQQGSSEIHGAIDADFTHLFSSWFNRGFLTLQRVDWNTPASILEKIIRYEAVHEIRSWDDLRRRLQPEDRRCYAFFHPQLPGEPLIFVEVALTENMPAAIAPLLREDQMDRKSRNLTHAVFYSISNCQKGMRGISFGNFLIKQVVEELRQEIPGLRHFITLSPVPGFAAWLRGDPASLPAEAAEVSRLVAKHGWANDQTVHKRLFEILPPLAATYFLSARNRDGRIMDPVARFHLGNGASLARINCFGDVAPKALRNQLGLMVNYRYNLDEVEQNHERFASESEVVAEPAVHALLAHRRTGLAGTWQRFSEATFRSHTEGDRMTNHMFDLVRARATVASRPFIEADDGRSFSYGDMLDRTASMAHALCRLGVVPGDRVAVQVEKNADMIMLYLACLRAGIVFLPLNTAYTSAEVEYFVNDSRPKLLVVDPARVEALASYAAAGGATLVSLGRGGTGSLIERAAAEPVEFDDIPRGPDDLAALLYTSGTTGRSKGAMLTHENLRSNAVALTEAWRFSADDVLIHALPLFHTHGLFVATNVILTAGARMILQSQFDPDRIVTALPKATAFMGVPTFYVRLLQHPGINREVTAGIRLFVSGSAPLLAETHAEWQRRTGHAILERYGMTETNMNTSNPYEGERRAGTVGFALPGTSVRIATADTGAELPQGQIGMIEVRGPNVFKGYWGMLDKTAAEFRRDGYFITGDLGRFDHDGYLHIVGRGKDLIIAGGYNIYPKEIELEIDSLPGVAESAVIGVLHPDLGEGVVAAVVADADASIDAEGIIEALAPRLARFKHPRRVVLVDELPRNSMGKVQKNVLRERYASLFNMATA